MEQGLRGLFAMELDDGQLRQGVARRGRRQQVTGVVVNETLGLSRQERRKLRAAIHQARKEGPAPEAAARIEGRLAYLSMLNPAQAAVLRKRWKPSG